MNMEYYFEPCCCNCDNCESYGKKIDGDDIYLFRCNIDNKNFDYDNGLCEWYI